MKPKDLPEVPKHRKSKKGVKKMFIIEWKYSGKATKHTIFKNVYEWSHHSKYETIKQRDQALQDLRRKEKAWIFRPIDL